MEKVVAPWLPDSPHAQIHVKLHERESELSDKHLLQNVLYSRIPAFQVNGSTGTHGISMQLIIHASNAILNHPFIHIVALRGNHGLSQSRLILQQTVDQALFHSGWVFRLIQTCELLVLKCTAP